MNKVAILIQARMSSRRLPGKVMLDLAGGPSIIRMMERVARVQRAAASMVVTSVEPSDDPLFELCSANGVRCVRGALDDVLKRFADACPSDCDIVVRLTGDCPLIDPGLVDEHIERFQLENASVDYLSNAVDRTQPDGLDVEVFSRATLEQASRAASEPADREHVTPWIIRNTRRAALTQKTDLSRLRWTLDNAEDYANISAVYDALYPVKPDFDRFDIYRLLVDRPELIRVAGRDALDAQEREQWRQKITQHLTEAR